MKNIIELKKKYNSIYKIKLEGLDICYRAFTAKEMILLMNGGEEKYKEEISCEAIINPENYDKLEKWTSKEIIYTNILKISGFGDEKELLNKKDKLKKNLVNNPYLIMIKQIIQVIPTININELLNYNADQLLFYTVLCEEIIGKQLIETQKSNNIPTPITSTQKKANFTPDQLIDSGMEASSNVLMQSLNKHGASIKQFVKKDQFEE